MASKDVYLELGIVFIAYFIIISFSKSLGEELIFMFIAFTLSNVISTLFITGIKGFVNHPLISKRKPNAEGAEKQLEERIRIHEMSYVFMLFFIFIIGSTIAGSFLSNTLVNDILFPYLGAVQGELLISGIITLATYVQMLYLFGEKIINPTSVGVMAILAVMILAFIFFGGYVKSIISYFGGPIHTIFRYSGLPKS